MTIRQRHVTFGASRAAGVQKRGKCCLKATAKNILVTFQGVAQKATRKITHVFAGFLAFSAPTAGPSCDFGM